ncbi:MAG: dTDP-4-dehydrorhamnose reductase [Planctomycetes bacterium]|nr:dTDP-4-dehydrorhamnose reductase [Planctomycetota bacterium]
MRIAVLGAAGQLGRDLCPRLPGDVIALTRADIDLSQPASIATALATARPDVLVNCAAYNFVDKAETEPEAAFAVNAWGVRALAQACATAKIRLVHFSTDYVFGLDATRSTPRTENDPPGPVSVYGLSKLAGEYLTLSTASNALVIRTCGLYGVHGSGGKGGNFVETMLRVAGQGKPLRVVADQFCTPSYTVDVAETAIGLIRAGASGLFQVTNAGSTTWHDFAAEIFRLAKLQADLAPITSAQFGAAARRPPYSVLSNAKLASVGVTAPRAWQEALAAYLVERAASRK